MLQLQSQSVLICLVNVTLTTKSVLHKLQFASHAAAIYYTEVGSEKSNREQTDREQTENRESNYRGHSNCRWIVGLSRPIYFKLVKMSQTN